MARRQKLQGGYRQTGYTHNNITKNVQDRLGRRKLNIDTN